MSRALASSLILSSRFWDECCMHRSFRMCPSNASFDSELTTILISVFMCAGLKTSYKSFFSGQTM